MCDAVVLDSLLGEIVEQVEPYPSLFLFVAFELIGEQLV